MPPTRGTLDAHHGFLIFSQIALTTGISIVMTLEGTRSMSPRVDRFNKGGGGFVAASSAF
jgi:hypothetical protein